MTPSDPALLKKANEVLLELARKDATDKGKPDPIKQGDYRGVTGYSAGPKEAYAIVEGRLVIADRGETVKAVIDRVLDGMGRRARSPTTPTGQARRAAVEARDPGLGLRPAGPAPQARPEEVRRRRRVEASAAGDDPAGRAGSRRCARPPGSRRRSTGPTSGSPPS